MKKEKKSCNKCGKVTYLDTHHILPKATFGKNDETIELCPTCHREYHEYLGRENLKNTSMEFHFYTFEKWLAGLTGFCIFIALIWIFIN